MKILTAKDAVYTENGMINAMVHFEGFDDFVPFTASTDDVEGHGREIFADLKSGKYGEVKPFTVTPEMLTAAKAAKRAQINAWRDAQENGRTTCTYNGNTYDADKQSKYRLDDVIEAGGLPDGVKWTDARNNDIALSLSDLKALKKIMVVAMAIQGGKIHERQRR
ncbi:DUF4376 domain-containing protein, partial [Salmonella enterica subsp. enterica serovar Newport str. CFSAN000599]|nr:DUF4376 domain-containing protein [Salmonella enterica subsp. enterica serovar Newport str. CFSAN000599]